MLIPAMGKAGYQKGESAAIVAAASAMGVLIPPCIFMVVLGSNFSISITALFLGGFIPAFVLAAAIMGLVWLRARRENWARAEHLTWGQRLRVFGGAIVPLMLPVIIFGGVLGGIVTVTEAAVIAVIYAMFVGIILYREVKPKQSVKILAESGVSCGSVLWLVGASSIFSWILARQGVPALIGQWIEMLSGSTWVFMTLAILVFILLGGVLEGLPALVILAPIFMPISQKFGIDPIHFGNVMIAALGLGVFLPPVGVGLFIAGSIAQVDMAQMVRKFWGYMVALIVGLLVIAYVPWLTLVLPRLLM
jgi:C4-dicarboxylate transporter DctM subunit